MGKKDAYLEHLAAVPLFANLAKRDLAAIAKSATEIAVKAGTVLVDQGQVGTEAFVIVEGRATITRNGRKITSVGPGAIVGEMSLIDRGPRSATAKMETDGVVLVLTQREFLGLIDESPAVSRKVMVTLARLVRESDRRTYG
ncbi:MAG: Crp/Fnr family transcriptional regulator [Acidimicrobiia bacterium]